MNNKMILIQLDQIANVQDIQNKLYLIPKYDSIRVVVKPKYLIQEKQDLHKVLSILKFLYKSYLKSPNNIFPNEYMSVVKENNLKNHKTYLISTDIYNAYGSVKQDKLFSIIKEMFENLPDKLILQWCVKGSIKRFKFINTNRDTLKTEAFKNKNIEIIEKFYVLQIMKMHIYNTKIAINKKVYNLTKGLVQGSMLSAILCDIYYAHMYRKNFCNFQHFGHLFTYVDDIFYITKDLSYASRFLDRIKKGIPEFNCWFNKSKLKHNLSDCSSDDVENICINYLGWKIYPNSLEIEPRYNSFRYSTIYTYVNHLTLNDKLRNFNYLKLSKIIFCKEINSLEQIFKNVKIISLQQAQRCYTFLNLLYKDQYDVSNEIVFKSNVKLIMRIESLTGWNEKEKNENRNRLYYITYKSFLQIFSKNDTFQNLIIEFKKLIKKYSKVD